MCATGKDKNQVPFTRISSAPTEFVGDFAMPNGVPFKDPSKYSGAEIAKILHLWRGRQRQGIIPFSFSHVVSEGKVEASEYAEGMFEEWILPKSNRLPKLNKSPPEVPTQIASENVSESSESTDAAQLPRQAWNLESEASLSGAEAPERSTVQRLHTNVAEQPRSPPPTEQSDAAMTPLHTRIKTRKIVISDEEHTPEPTMPTNGDAPNNQRHLQLRTTRLDTLEEESMASDESPPKATRALSKVQIPVARKTTRHRQLATPGPSDSATPTTSDIGTPIRQLRGRLAEATPVPEVRKSSRLRKVRTRT